ncbi:ChaN family lipoprotein [Hymenobacter properus]|uniref:ChaN family lipoprotein n=1 Tax=Hymenobacter properus TaxID=2791026 RepID=A0A931BPU3_9BACT|nr:ChaN family lipoprotein [Hymenobacter properus]MBF9143410.1 ChaN family lipoprotein [Hymenobacter properus]MBR7722223.1 ChaN family lipoprotein [Microvirga sp. SRT04]
MRFLRRLSFFLLVIGLASFTGDRPAYRLFSATGQPADYDQMLQELTQADVVLFGEQHNDALAHWLELQVAKDLLKLKKPGQLVLGMEMFERDVQPLVSQYAAGTLADTAFERQARPWPNYATDYRPLLQLARENHLPVIGTNAPRPFAKVVAQRSLTALDKLPAVDRALLAPLPLKVDYELPGYKNMAAMFGGSGTAHGGGAQNIIQAQALKDATMAHFIQVSRQPGQTLLHFNGSYHSDHHDGIVAYLRQYAPKLRVKTLSVVTQEQLPTLDKEQVNIADFVVVVPADAPKTY